MMFPSWKWCFQVNTCFAIRQFMDITNNISLQQGCKNTHILCFLLVKELLLSKNLRVLSSPVSKCKNITFRNSLDPDHLPIRKEFTKFRTLNSANQRFRFRFKWMNHCKNAMKLGSCLRASSWGYIFQRYGWSKLKIFRFKPDVYQIKSGEKFIF